MRPSTTARAHFAYAGAFTANAPGGRSPAADAAPARGITVFGVSADTGALRPLQSVASANPAHLVLDAAQSHLYAINEIDDYGGQGNAGSVEAYAVDPASGYIRLLNRQAIGIGPAHCSLHPSGDFMVVASYAGAAFQLLPIAADGSVGPVVHTLQQSGSGPHPRQQGPHPHMALCHPGGRFIATTDLGNDQVEILTIDGGQLRRVCAFPLPAGSGPRHLVFEAGALYVLSELTARIAVIRFDPDTGQLGPVVTSVETVPLDFPAHKSTAAILMHPTGEFLYVSNRKFSDHPLADSIVAFAVEDSGNRLRLIGHTTTDIAFARTMAIDPSGDWLYAVNQKGDCIVQFAIDPERGTLTPTGRRTPITTPTGLVFRTA